MFLFFCGSPAAWTCCFFRWRGVGVGGHGCDHRGVAHCWCRITAQLWLLLSVGLSSHTSTLHSHIATNERARVFNALKTNAHSGESKASPPVVHAAVGRPSACQHERVFCSARSIVFGSAALIWPPACTSVWLLVLITLCCSVTALCSVLF